MLCGQDVENWSDWSDWSDEPDGSDESDLSDWSDWSDLTKPNATNATVSTGTLETLERVFRHGVLVEENTGRLCMNCPREMVGMKELCDAYPEQMVGIAIHRYNQNVYQDPMYLAEYNPKFKEMESGAPFFDYSERI